MKKPIIIITLALALTGIATADTTTLGNEEICGETQAENIVINQSIEICTEGEATLNATNDIIINATIDGAGEDPGFTGEQTNEDGSNLTLTADYIQQNKPIILDGGKGEYSNSGNPAAEGGNAGTLNITANTYHSHKISLDGGQGGQGSTTQNDEELAKGAEGGKGGKLHIEAQIFHNSENITANSGEGGEPGEWGHSGVVGGDGGNASQAGYIYINTARTIIEDGYITAKGVEGTTGGDGEYDSITDACGVGGDGGQGGTGGKININSNNLLIEESELYASGGDGGQGGQGADCEDDGDLRQGGDGGNAGNASKPITIHSGNKHITTDTILENEGGDSGERGEDKEEGITPPEAGEPGDGHNINLLFQEDEKTTIENNILSVDGGLPKGDIEETGGDGETTLEAQEGEFKETIIKFTEINKNTEQFSKNTREPVKINATINKTYLDIVHLITDETGEDEEYTAYTTDIHQKGDETLIQYEWTDLNNVLQAEPITYQAQVEGLTTVTSEENQFDLVMNPVIDQTAVDATVNEDGIAIIQSNVLHPIGKGRINEVEYEIERPDGTTDTHVARPEEEIQDDGLEGYRYIHEYVGTQDAGTYGVTITAKGDGGEVTYTDSFIVSPIEAIGRGEISLNPFMIGGESIVDAILAIDTDNTYAQLGGAILIISILVGLINVIGDSGAERNRFLQEVSNR